MGYRFYEDVPASVELPHPPISLAVFLVVEEAFCAAWEKLRTIPRVGCDLLVADEDVVTQELYEVLYDEVFGKNTVDGFNHELFTTVTRESKVRNYDRLCIKLLPSLVRWWCEFKQGVMNKHFKY